MKEENLKENVGEATNFKNPSGNKTKLLLALGVLLLLVLFSAGSYFLGLKGVKISLTTKKNQPPVIEQQVANTLPDKKVSQTPLFSGNLKRINQNLKIFKITENDKLNGIENDFIYYEAGVFNSGELKGYTRVIASRPPEGPGNPLIFILATKDFKTYILDDPDNKAGKYKEDDWQNPYGYFDKKTVVSTKIFDTEQPKELDLNQNFSLYWQEFTSEIIPTSKTDKNGSKVYENVLVTEFSSYRKLSSPFENLIFYFKPYLNNSAYLAELPKTEKEKEILKQKYFIGETEIIVVDSTGLPITYALTTPEKIKIYHTKFAQYEAGLLKYYEDMKKFDKKEIKDMPIYPDYVYLPNLGFTISEISNKDNLKFYNDYESAIPDACAIALNTRVFNVKDSDLKQIGTVLNLPLYKLKDKNHELFLLAYKNKMDYYDQDPKMFGEVNKGIKKPTLEEYADNNPLLFFKDNWGRFVAAGEFDIKLPGGCGKPVIYLYPQKPTEVSVEFQVPIQFTTDIPKYRDSWRVMAYPDSSLVNIRAQSADCQNIDFLKKGSEYAKEACQKNIYPYLYWAGNTNSHQYPNINDGWIVERNNLNEFLENKLTEIGLNDNERSDFISYWLPEMLSKKTSFYRIAFLQTADLNFLFPMIVSPVPDTAFRLFLDYLPLIKKPQTPPNPQVLNKLIRKGFTLVEWGGLKRP